MHFLILINLFLGAVTAIQANCDNSCDGDHYCYFGQCISCSQFREEWELQKPDFGVVIGHGNKVPAYSCENDTQHILELQHYIQPQETGLNQTVYVGMKYQCVHYARLYWIIKYGSAFPDIDTADEIFFLDYAVDYLNGGNRQILKYYNGGKERPLPGDLIIWNKSQPYYPYGHVAVILDVQLSEKQPYVTIGEQNYDDMWDTPQYARKLQVTKNNQGNYYIVNQREITNLNPQEKCKDYNGSAQDAIIGWVRLI